MKVKNVILGSAALAVTLVGTAMAGPAVEPADEGAVFSIALFKVIPGQEEAFEKVMKTVSVASRNEPGNLEYRIHRSIADPHVYTAYEVFRTADDAKAHLASKHIQDALPLVLKMVEGGKIDVQGYTMVK